MSHGYHEPPADMVATLTTFSIFDGVAPSILAVETPRFLWR